MLVFAQELAAIKARVQELEMEEETERLKEVEEEERLDAGEMHLLTSSPRPGETAHGSYICHVGCYSVTLLYSGMLIMRLGGNLRAALHS